LTRIILVTQACCIPSILSGNDTIVAGETGSGKTHGYLVPVMEKLLHTVSNLDRDDPVKGKRYSSQMSLVLCPNVMLCEQVVCMANSLCSDNGEHLLRAAAVCGTQVVIVNAVLLSDGVQNYILVLHYLVKEGVRLAFVVCPCENSGTSYEL